jgi:hypothetical protein
VIGVNLFNLLPIYPLDGGRIINLLIFLRYPHLGVLYQIMGVLFFLMLGRRDPVLLVVALIIALMIPSSWRTAQWLSRLRQDLKAIPWDDDKSSARLIFMRLQSDPKLSSAQKMSIASSIFESRRAGLAPFWSQLGLFLVYLVSLLGGIIGGFYAIVPSWLIVESMIRKILAAVF